MPELAKEIQYPETTVPCPNCGRDNRFLSGSYSKLCDYCAKVMFRDWQDDEVKK